jgi:glycosyltransferase involved in cell wall biosynthesis
MKIVIATGSFGGPVSYSRLLESRLPSYRMKVEVVSFGEVLKYPKVIRHFVFFLRLKKAVSGADLLYAQDPVSVGLPALLASKVQDKPFFLKIVGDYAWEQGQARYGIKESLDDFVKNKKKYPLSVEMFRFVEKLVANQAKKIIVPSNYLKGVVTAWGIAPESIEVIFNAFNAPIITETKEELRKTYAYTYPTIVSAGRLVPWKEFPTLIMAFTELSKTYKDAKLFIIDEGPEKRALMELTRELGIEEKVTFIGKVPQQELHKRIKAADCFVLASSYEGFSHVLLEALSLGTPVISSTAGGNPELIEDGKDGLLVTTKNKEELEAALLKLCGDTMLQTQFGVAGKRKLEQFKEEHMVEKLLKTLV